VKRLFWKADLMGRDSAMGEHPMTTASRVVCPEAEANLVGSLTGTGMHAPTLDIDRMAVRVVGSSTEGNFHLFIDKEMPWERYEALLIAFEGAGILEHGYVSASIERQCTFVRKEGVSK
jgi:hypothetical protein